MKTSKLLNNALKRRGLVHVGIRHNSLKGRLLTDEWKEDGEILPLVNTCSRSHAKDVPLSAELTKTSICSITVIQPANTIKS